MDLTERMRRIVICSTDTDVVWHQLWNSLCSSIKVLCKYMDLLYQGIFSWWIRQWRASLCSHPQSLSNDLIELCDLSATFNPHRETPFSILENFFHSEYASKWRCMVWPTWIEWCGSAVQQSTEMSAQKPFCSAAGAALSSQSTWFVKSLLALWQWTNGAHQYGSIDVVKSLSCGMIHDLVSMLDRSASLCSERILSSSGGMQTSTRSVYLSHEVGETFGNKWDGHVELPVVIWGLNAYKMRCSYWKRMQKVQVFLIQWWAQIHDEFQGHGGLGTCRCGWQEHSMQSRPMHASPVC